MKPLISTKLKQTTVSLAFAWIGLALALTNPGCKSLNEPNSASFASVIIKDHSGEEVAKTVRQVFVEDGYKGGMTGEGEMTFEKEASRGATLAREGLINTYYGEQSINRVRVELLDMENDTIRVQCKAYKVSGGSDPFFQEEIPISNMGAGPYRSLLNKVAEQLK